MAALIAKGVQVLLDQPKGQGMVVSCYADTSIAEGFESHWLQPFKTEASRIRQRLADDHQARLEFERDLEAIRQALESPEARQARGMAVFSAASRGFFLALPAPVPHEDRLVVDEEPYVVPLLEAWPFTSAVTVAVLYSGRMPVHSPMDDHWCFRSGTLAILHFAQLDPLLPSWMSSPVCCLQDVPAPTDLAPEHPTRTSRLLNLPVTGTALPSL